jgi:hypothetical protein
MIKKASRLQINDITETKKRLGERELSNAKLKQVGGGIVCQGGTCTLCDDCDE